MNYCIYTSCCCSLKSMGTPPIIFQIWSFFNITNQLVTFDKNLTGMTSVKLWNYFRITSRFFPFVIPGPFLILPFHSPQRKCVIGPRKKTWSFVCLLVSSSRIFLLVLVNDFLRRLLAGPLPIVQMSLKSYLPRENLLVPDYWTRSFSRPV